MRRPHNGRGHSFVGVPVAYCTVEGCKATATRSPYPVLLSAGPATSRWAGGGARAFPTVLGSDPWGVTER